MQNHYGVSHWSNCDSLGRTEMPLSLVTVENLLIQNLRVYLKTLQENLIQTDIQVNSVTEQEAIQQLKEYLQLRIEKTKDILSLIV
jgi:hypothetical protein